MEWQEVRLIASGMDDAFIHDREETGKGYHLLHALVYTPDTTTMHGSNRQYDVRTAVVDNVGVQRLPTILNYGQEKTLERCRFRFVAILSFILQLFSQQSGNQHLTYENTDCVAQEHVRSGCGAGCCSSTQSPQKQYMHYCQGKL